MIFKAVVLMAEIASLIELEFDTYKMLFALTKYKH